jgi:hypothetical protein
MTVNGNVSTEYVNLAPISLVEENAMANGVNPNDIDFDSGSDATMSVAAVGGFEPEEFIFTLTPLVLAHVDFGDGNGDYFSPIATTGHPASAAVYHAYQPGDNTYTVTVTADGYTPATTQAVVGLGKAAPAKTSRAATARK